MNYMYMYKICILWKFMHTVQITHLHVQTITLYKESTWPADISTFSEVCINTCTTCLYHLVMVIKICFHDNNGKCVNTQFNKSLINPKIGRP